MNNSGRDYKEVTFFQGVAKDVVRKCSCCLEAGLAGAFAVYVQMYPLCNQCHVRMLTAFDKVKCEYLEFSTRISDLDTLQTWYDVVVVHHRAYQKYYSESAYIVMYVMPAHPNDLITF